MVAVGGNVLSFDLISSLWREPGLDVIHSHALGRLGAIGRLVARTRRLPFVLSVHGGAYDLPAEVRRELGRPAAGGWDWGKPLGLLLRARRAETRKFDHNEGCHAVRQRRGLRVKPMPPC